LVARRYRRRQIPTDGASVHPHLASDALDAVAGGATPPDFVPFRAAASSSKDKVLLRLTRRWHWCRRRGALLFSGRVGDGHILPVAAASEQHLVHGGACIRRQVEAIRNLDRLRRALASSFGVGTSSIADDDLDAGVCAQPVGENLGGAVIEQVNGPMRFQ